MADGPVLTEANREIGRLKGVVAKQEKQIEALKCAGFAAVFGLALSLHARPSSESVKRKKAAFDAAAAEDSTP